MAREKYKIVDLFCGCGGLSRGFEASGRFGTQYGVELQRHPAAAFATNIKNVSGGAPHVHVGDIAALAGDRRLLWAELRAAGIRKPGEIDVLAGGPPCQGFSRNGVRLYKDDAQKHRFYDHPKNHLYKSFLGIVELTKPKIVLVENVREFLNFGNGKFSSDLSEKFAELGYVVDHKKICAADYGVPQIRHRVFFVAIREDVADKAGSGPSFPKPEFFPAGATLPLGQGREYRTVRDAIGDLPPPGGEKRNIGLSYPINGRISALAEALRSPQGTVFNHFARPLSKKQIERINAVGSGRMKHIDPKLQTRKFYGSAYRRLKWDEPSLTITTWVYHVGSGQFAHPVEDRGVTMREAARLQSFDDAFVFPPLVNPVSQMIGNAVPPLVARRFAEAFAKILDRVPQ